jgi:hypothetical protein
VSAWTAATLADRRCDLARRDVRAGAPLQRAAAYALAAQQTPAPVLAASWALSLLRDGVRPAHVRAALADAFGLAALDDADQRRTCAVCHDPIRPSPATAGHWWHDRDRSPGAPDWDHDATPEER